MNFSYNTKNTCSKKITFSINNGIITNVKFLGGGCPGNLQALPILVEGLSVEEIETKLGHIVCGRRNTSCAQELAIAVRIAEEKIENEEKNE